MSTLRIELYPENLGKTWQWLQRCIYIEKRYTERQLVISFLICLKIRRLINETYLQ